MSRGKGTNVMVLDVEGTDSQERGDNQVRSHLSVKLLISRRQKNFGRKSTLFSLAVSEVLIINLCHNQVGLHQGAHLELLRTILEVNLELFGNQPDEGYAKLE
jgi:protein SEY1